MKFLLLFYLTVVFCTAFAKIRNFTSPHTIRVEAGLASMMDQYDANFKVQRILGRVRTKKHRTSSALDDDSPRPAELVHS